MRWSRVFPGLALAIAVVAAIAAWGTCGVRTAGDGTRPPAPIREDEPAAPERAPPPRRETPRAAPPSADVAVPPMRPLDDATAADADGERIVTIRVVSLDGAAPRGVRVRAWAIRHLPVLVFDPIVPADGDVREVVPGPDGIARFRVPAGVPRVGSYATAPGFHTGCVVFDLAETLEGTITLGAGASVSGTVLDAAGKPVAAASVRLVPIERPERGRAGDSSRLWAEPGIFEFYVTTVRTDASGRYSVPGVPTPPDAGLARRVAIAEDADGRWWRGGEFLAESAGQSFTADVQFGATPYVAEPAPVAIPLIARGRVVDAATGDAIEGASVRIVAPRADGLPETAQRGTRADGSFQVGVLWDGSRPRDEVQLRVSAPERTSLIATLTDGPVVLRLARATAPPLPGTVVGRILGPDGLPVSGVRWVEFRQPSGDVATRRILADADGQFRVEGLAANWWSVRADDESPWTPIDLAEDGQVRVDLHLTERPPVVPAWTDADEAAAARAVAELAAATAALDISMSESELVGRDAPDQVPPALRYNQALMDLSDVEGRRMLAAPRREVLVRGLLAQGRAWLEVGSHGELWVAEVRAGDARVPALFAGKWTCTLRIHGADARTFSIDVPAGTGPATIDAHDEVAAPR